MNKNISFKSNSIKDINIAAPGVLYDKNRTYSDIQTPLLDALEKYKESPCVGFHIPGHNRGNGVLGRFEDLVGRDALLLDTTDEFDGLGTLHPATGAIGDAMKLASIAYNSKKTFFITSGSTISNLAIAFGVISPNDEIIVARNSHRSVITGTMLSGANATWLMPKLLNDWSIFGAIEAEELEYQLNLKPNAKFVWIVNPTYEGMVSDIKKMAEICKKHNVPLIVDEAHGSLWNFSDELPASALELGADAVVHSLHKTGGSMTQSSMLHIAKGSKLDVHKIEHALKLLHTTSPSVLLLASLDAARAHLGSNEGKKLIKNAIENAKYFRSEAKNIKNLSVLGEDDGVNFDITHIFIKMKGLSGKRLETILELDFNIEIESASDEGILILSNIGNTRKEFEYLIKALSEISRREYPDICHLEGKKYMPLMEPVTVMSPRDAYFAPKKLVKLEDAVGKISAEVIALCPPGISVLLPGEIIHKEHLPYLSDYSEIEVIDEK